MRIPVNLASEPFRRDRPMIIASGVVSGLLVASLLLFVSLAWTERQRSADARATVAGLEGQLAAISAEQARLDAQLRQTQNSEVLEKAQFINTLLMRKGVSWTRMFADLENVVPYSVRLISVRPQINARNDVILDITAGAPAPEPVLDLLMKLEAAPQFGRTTVHNWLAPTQSEPLFRYRLSVEYAQRL